ncbi:MFS transporter [Rhodococcus erythropolis]|uniref:MFS transporter n=1 Tax=Rhodococcus erythropolis TaxID=1833 RepID=UPI001BEBEC02|nr:MFS transporter [Rhodococcus erythropolis]MBT2269026.1 MFS transporter [Rhodococcus erythropolis]
MSVSLDNRRSSVALWIVFFVNGAVLASWAPRIPQVKSALGLSDGAMGLALLGVAAGSVPALLGTAHLLRRVDARTMCVSSAVVFAGALPLVAWAPNGWALACVLAVLGAASGCLDVAMNTAAIEFQTAAGTSILSRLHGGYSLGVLAGAGSGAVASRFDFTVLEHFLAVSVSLLILVASASRWVPAGTVGSRAVSAASPLRPDGRSGAIFAIPAAIGALAIAALLVEGMVTDWSALLISRDFGAGATVGAVAVVVFSTAMFVSRTFGDLVVATLGAARAVTAAAAVVAVAVIAGVVVQHSVWGAIVAIGCVGLALGPLFPLAIVEAGRRSSGGVALATARVSAVGYAAYLGGPPVVGFLADHVGLRPAFVAIALVCCAVLFLVSPFPAPRR